MFYQDVFYGDRINSNLKDMEKEFFKFNLSSWDSNSDCHIGRYSDGQFTNEPTCPIFCAADIKLQRLSH